MNARAKINPRSPPKQERAQATYDLLLDVAGELLGEVGIERISTNMICARAGLTPPALYRYFKDKYAVLEALGQRLMTKQNDVLEAWIARHVDQGVDALRDNIEELMRETAAVTRPEPGAVWILRALHATPQLAHIRLESHRYVTDRLVEAYARNLPDADRDKLWQELRLTVELGFAADEMLYEETRVSPDAIFRLTARMLRGDQS
ncbi:TetR/AcrR family transcriptional regulator [Sphingopyxis sp. Root1497]|uniref:TetR/AcrR family transcriptional regulator n=1 Tax=Sphingopyxis sp. Root1497 TaxID=1736474 RepID=UPI000A6B1BA8|nr:TetR/AcrR family transcriptional regulator [Sphingopyxis sp. Root1497]